MHKLRSSSLLARLVLAWFMATLGVAVASPAVRPLSMQVLCSAAGSIKVLVTDDDGRVVDSGHHSLDCSLCFAAAPPTSPVSTASLPSHATAHVLEPAYVAHIAALVGAPLPPRGPPTRD